MNDLQCDYLRFLENHPPSFTCDHYSQEEFAMRLPRSFLAPFFVIFFIYSHFSSLSSSLLRPHVSRHLSESCKRRWPLSSNCSSIPPAPTPFFFFEVFGHELLNFLNFHAFFSKLRLVLLLVTVTNPFQRDDEAPKKTFRTQPMTL